MRSTPLLFAHRGASVELPENTMPAFRRALEVGATAIETDAHLTRDGHVVLSHDDDIARTAGIARRIRDVPLREVQSWNVGATFRPPRPGSPRVHYKMPTLGELLSEMPGVPLNVDIKRHDAWAARAVVDIVRRHRAQDHVRLASFDTATLRRVRALGYEGPTGLGASEVGSLVTLPAAVLGRLLVGGSAAQIPVSAWRVRLDSIGFLAKAHSLGLVVHYWTIDEPLEAERLLRLGADGIMTNDPARIAPVLARFAGT